MQRPSSDSGSVTAELALALPTVALVEFVTLGAFSLQLEKMKLVSIAGTVARGVARGEAESKMRELVGQLRPGTAIDLRFEPDSVCAKAFFNIEFAALGGQSIEVADWQCARHNLEAAREGRPQLPMGNNALANTLYRYHTEVQGMAPEEARWESAVTASITSALIAGVTLAMGVAIGVPVRAGISITRFAISASYRLHSVGELGLARLLASRQREVGRQGGHETGAPDAAGAASPSTPALPRCFDDQALEPLMDLLKAQGLVGPARTEAAAHALSTPRAPAMTSIAESEFGDADSEVDDASESEETDEAGSESVDEDSDDEWFPGAVGTPAAEPPRAPAATPPPRVLTRHEAELLTRWVQTASSFDPLIDAVGDPDPAVRAHRFDAFLAELVRKDEASARMARLGDARFVGVNSIYLASFLRGLVTFCLAR
mgnify:CR=1 FL=1